MILALIMMLLQLMIFYISYIYIVDDIHKYLMKKKKLYKNASIY